MNHAPGWKVEIEFDKDGAWLVTLRGPNKTVCSGSIGSPLEMMETVAKFCRRMVNIAGENRAKARGAS